MDAFGIWFKYVRQIIQKLTGNYVQDFTKKYDFDVWYENGMSPKEAAMVALTDVYGVDIWRLLSVRYIGENYIVYKEEI